MYQLFVEKLKAKLKQAKEELVDDLSQGRGKDDYDRLVGRLQGYDHCILFAEQVIRELQQDD